MAYLFYTFYTPSLRDTVSQIEAKSQDQSKDNPNNDVVMGKNVLIESLFTKC